MESEKETHPQDVDLGKGSREEQQGGRKGDSDSAGGTGKAQPEPVVTPPPG